MSEAVVFSQSYESLLRVFGPALTADVRTKFKALGVDVERLLPAYPLQTWVASLRLALEVLWPNVPEEEATYLLGRRIFESYGETLLGGALLGLLRVLGPVRGLHRMERNLRTSNNYSRTSLVQRGPTHFELSVNLVNFPQYYRGLFEAGLQRAGATHVQVEVLSRVGNDVTFALSWQG